MNKAEKILIHDKLDVLGDLLSGGKNSGAVIDAFNDIRAVIKKL